MANKNAKNTMNGTDVFVVAPSNMGKGLAYNESVKQYEVNAQDANGVKLNPDGTVGVAVSPDGGNQIELRDNGLYVGNQVRADKANFYVSSTSGNDNNDGSKNSPFRTIYRAFNAAVENKSNGVYRIFLKAGEYFEFPKTRVWIPHTNMSLEIHHYGDAKYPDLFDCFGVYRPYGAPDLNRPTLAFTQFFDTNVNSIIYSGFDTAGSFALKMYGLRVSYESLTPGGVAGVGFYHDELVFEGCHIILSPQAIGIASAGVVRLRGNLITNANPSVQNMFISDLTPKIWAFDPLREQGQGLGRAPDFSPQLGNEKRVMKASNMCSLAAYNESTRSLFGFSTNWDPFENY